jgi:hypothetical protein
MKTVIVYVCMGIIMVCAPVVVYVLAYETAFKYFNTPRYHR